MQLFKLEENQTTLQQVGTRNIKEIKVINYGKSHFTIITKQDDIYVYGNNDYGKLGTGNNLSVNELTKINYDTKTFIRNIKHLICGDTFTIIGTTKSELFFTGHLSYFYDSFKFIKLKHFINNLEIKFISNGRYNNLFIVTKDNSVYCTGRNYSNLGINQLSINQLTKIDYLNLEIKDLQCSSNHSIILDNFGNIYGCGNNNFGQLGNLKKGIIPKFEKINFTPKVKHIYCLENDTFIITDNNELYGTGYNTLGRLGLGDYKFKYEFTKIPFHEEIDIIFKNFCSHLTLLRTLNNNEYYFSGKNVFGIPNDKCKYFDSGYGFNSHYYVDKFTKINLFNDLFNNNNNNEMKYCYPILMTEEKLVIYLNYKIFYGNKVCEDEVTLGLKCLEKITSIQLTDLTFNF